ncbi:MAG: thiamine phosphate synthase [Aureispira sp.]
MLEHRLYTWPNFLEGEGKLINELFARELPYLHLRKPNSSLEECQTLLEQINPIYYSQIILHQYWELGKVLKLGGVHWTERQRTSLSIEAFAQQVADQQAAGYQVGTAIHHPKQLEELPETLNYVTVSPVFESISKPNYQANYQWKDDKTTPFLLVALGGIAPDKLEAVQARGFHAVAVLGAVWQPLKSVLQNYEQLWQGIQQVEDLTL